MALKVSIVIPVYNGHKYLGDAIGSALRQTYRNIEIIVVNDGSNDGGRTRSVARQYGSTIRYIEQENRGVGGALNTGLAAMSGEIFCWLSHDDVYRPNKIERQVDFFNRLGRDDAILFSNYALIDESGRVTAQTAMEHVIGDKPPLALLRGCINGCTIFVPKKIFDEVGQFDEKLRFTQDYDMWKRMSPRHSFVLMPDVLVDYRMHAEQGTRNAAATEEANRLWINLVENTSLADRVVIAGSSLRFLQSQAEFLAATPYDLATAHTYNRAETCIEATKVSVIIPFFNEIVAAKRAILSALAQKHGNLEIIAVDDGSTEDTAVLDLLATADNRLRILHKTNGGPASARNLGMRAATGEYIGFLDSDDTWAPEKLALQIRRIQESGKLFSHTSYNLIHPGRNLGVVTRRTGKMTGTVYPDIIGMCPIHSSTVVIHRQLVDDGYVFPEAFRIGEDCLLWIDIACRYPLLGLDIPMTTVEWSDTTAAISLSRSIEGTRNIRNALSTSKLHAEHAGEIGVLSKALAYFENIQAQRRDDGTNSDVNFELMTEAFEGAVLSAFGRAIETEAPSPAASRHSLSTARLRTRLYQLASVVRWRLLAQLKRLARSTLPRPVIEALKAIMARGYRPARAITMSWVWVDQLRAAGKRLEFEDACKDLLSRFPGNPAVWLGAGIRATLEGRNDLALPWLEKAAALCDTALTEVYIGQVWRELGDYAKSEKHYRAALVLDSDEPQAHVGLAIILGALGAFGEALDHVGKAAKCGLDPGYGDFLRASVLVGMGQFDEADAIFSKNIAIGVPPPYKTDTRILRFGAGYRHVMNKSPTVPSAKIPVDAPAGGSAVYFLCCDGVYFERFIEAVVNACVHNSGVDLIVHVHLVNRPRSADAILARVRGRLAPDRLRVTEETVDLSGFGEAERRVFHACRRFYLVPELLRIYARPLLCADVDQLIVRPIAALLAEMTGHDVGLVHDPLNATNVMSYFSATAAFFAPTEAAFLFAERVCRYIDFFLSVERSPLWHLDQAALTVTYLNDTASVRLCRFPVSIVHSRPVADEQLGDAVFWSITFSVEQNAEKLQSAHFLKYA